MENKMFSFLQDILAPTNKVLYEVPDYQRAYSWEIKQCNELFDDIVDNEVEYFVGPIICIVGVPDSQNDPIPYTVVDGQQRLTTLSILILSIISSLDSEKIKDAYGDESEEYQRYLRAKSSLHYKIKDREYNVLVPQEDNENKSDYDYLVRNKLGLKSIKKPTNFGNRRIARAFKNYLKKIKKMSLSEKMELLDKVLKTQLVSINVKDDTQAFQLFESLNNRGLPLSIIDLMNTSVVKEASKIDDATKQSCNNDWKQMKINIGDDAKIQERFLRQYYNAVEKTTSNIRAKRGNLLDLYKNLFENNCVEIVERVLKASEIYSRISTKDIMSDDKYYKELLDLCHAEGTTSYTLLMFLFLNESDKGLDSDDIKKTIRTLTNFFIVRSITEKPATRKLDDMFIEIIDKINATGFCNFYDETVSILLKYQPVTKNEIEDELKKDAYLEYTNVTRFLLSYYEINSTGVTKGSDYNKFWKRKGNRLEYSIEHVLPEGENLPDEWVEMLDPKGKDKAVAANIQSRVAHKIGNLTLTPFNSELGNRSLSEKQNLDKEKGGYKNTNYYLNGEMNCSVITPGKGFTAIKDARSWGEKEINDRTDFLVGQFVKKLFPINNENELYK